jgi:putative glutamine amidotransferase
MMPPLVAVTTSFQAATDGRPERAVLNAAYIRAIEVAGAVPVLVAPQFGEAAIESIMARVDGLVLTGGGDLCPELYGEQPVPEAAGMSPERDRMELEALRIALERGVPVLAICRGLQLLNVAMGGSLWQDLPSQRPGVVGHAQTAGGRHARDETTHGVSLAEGSCLAQVLGSTEVAVNSMHHQAIKELGDGVAAVGYAPDGVVEAIEMPEERWVLGVQWHPEELFEAHEHARRLFAAFARACEQGE